MTSSKKTLFLGLFLISLIVILFFYKKAIEPPVRKGDLSGMVHQSLVNLNFLSSFKEAKIKSKNEHKLIFAFTRAQWCPFSERTIETVLSNNQYQSLLNKFVLLHFDMESFDFLKLNTSKRIQGTNTVLIFNQEGQEIARFNGTDLEKNGTEILMFLGRLDSTVREITPKMASSRIIFDTLVADNLSFYKAKSYSVERLRKEKEKIQIFKNIHPNVEMVDVELEMDILIAQNQGTLNEFYGKLITHKNYNMLADVARFGNLPREYNEELRKKAIEGIYQKINKDRLLNDEPASLKDDFETLYILEEAKSPQKSIRATLDYYDYVKSKRVKTKSHLIYLAHMLSFDQDSLPESLKVYDELISRAPELISIRIRKAKVLIKKGRYKEAIEILNSSLPKSYGDNEFHAYWLLHLSYEGLGEIKKSNEILKESYLMGKMTYGKDAELFSKYKKIKEKYYIESENIH